MNTRKWLLTLYKSQRIIKWLKRDVQEILKETEQIE
jgi:hypothetical protein